MARQSEKMFESKQSPEPAEVSVFPAGSADKFKKERLLKSKRFSSVETDVLTVLLEDGKEYSFAEVEQILSEFMKGDIE